MPLFSCDQLEAPGVRVRLGLGLAVVVMAMATACKGAGKADGSSASTPSTPSAEALRPVQVPHDTAPAPPAIAVKVDDRIELMAILERLAKVPEYSAAATSAGAVADYREQVDLAFAPFATDPAVVMTRQLRAQHGIGHDAPIQFAVHLDADRQLVDGADLAAQDPRWVGVDVAAYAVAVRQFAQASKFDAFVSQEQPAAAAIETSTRAIAAKYADAVPWFDALCGRPPHAHFTVVPSLITGDWNYSAHVTAPDGSLAIYQVLGVPGGDGPADTDLTGYLLVHELGHSYVNPVIAKHADELRATGEGLLARAPAAMAQQAYTTGQIVLAESVVRAAVALYFGSKAGPPALLADVKFEQSRGFAWMPAMVEALRDVQAARSPHPDQAFEAFVTDLPTRFPPRLPLAP